jgi:hypothetical protein
MGRYLRSNWFRVGLALAVIGAGPLLLIILAAALGLWPDPHPNPIGPGLLFALLFWPSAVCLFIGVRRVRRAQRDGALR